MNPHARTLFAAALLLTISVVMVPPAGATHEDQPPAPWEVICPTGDTACSWNNLGAWWTWLTHVPFPSQPCLPHQHPACM